MFFYLATSAKGSCEQNVIDILWIKCQSFDECATKLKIPFNTCTRDILLWAWDIIIIPVSHYLVASIKLAFKCSLLSRDSTLKLNANGASFDVWLKSLIMFIIYWENKSEQKSVQLTWKMSERCVLSKCTHAAQKGTLQAVPFARSEPVSWCNYHAHMQ